MFLCVIFTSRYFANCIIRKRILAVLFLFSPHHTILGSRKKEKLWLYHQFLLVWPSKSLDQKPWFIGSRKYFWFAVTLLDLDTAILHNRTNSDFQFSILNCRQAYCYGKKATLSKNKAKFQKGLYIIWVEIIMKKIGWNFLLEMILKVFLEKYS